MVVIHEFIEDSPSTQHHPQVIHYSVHPTTREPRVVIDNPNTKNDTDCEGWWVIYTSQEVFIIITIK